LYSRCSRTIDHEHRLEEEAPCLIPTGS
jgi:hypothetical protein